MNDNNNFVTMEIIDDNNDYKDDKNSILIKIQEDLPSFVSTYIEKKQKHTLATRKYALKDPTRTRGYAKNYYHKNKNNPDFKQNMRERALKYYYNKKQIQ